jgi:hypothetical protein
MRSLVVLIIGLGVLGVVLYLINAFVPMDAKIKQLLNVIVIVAVLIWVLLKYVVPWLPT